MFDMNEAMTLGFDIVGFAVLMFFLLKGMIPRFPFLIAAYCCVLLSNTFTVVEGFWLPDVFNLLEHLAYLGASICVLAGVHYYARARD
jgi:hypothetical protein